MPWLKYVYEDVFCEAIRKGEKWVLETFPNKASPEAVAAGIVTVAKLVCTKSYKRFTRSLHESSRLLNAYRFKILLFSLLLYPSNT